MKTFEILTGTLVSIEAETEEEAMALLADGEYEELEVMSVVWNVV